MIIWSFEHWFNPGATAKPNTDAPIHPHAPLNPKGKSFKLLLLSNDSINEVAKQQVSRTHNKSFEVNIAFSREHSRDMGY